MYSAFRIQNFRCFEDVALTDLARINLIGGQNNTGKTSLLEAVMLHSGYIDAFYLFRLEATGDWESCFYNFDLKRVIKLQADLRVLGSPQDKLESKILEITEADLREESKVKSIPLPHITFSYPNVRVNPRSLKFSYDQSDYYMSTEMNSITWSAPRKYPYTNFVSGFPRTSAEALNFAFTEIAKKAEIRELLTETIAILEPRLTHIELLGGGRNLYGHIGLSQPVSLSHMGDGVSRLAEIMLMISANDNKFVCIEEIENGLHHSVLTKVWRAIYQAAVAFNVQIFATTHSDEMIQAAQEAFADDPAALRYYRLDRKKTGQIKAVMYEPEILEEAFLSDVEVRG